MTDAGHLRESLCTAGTQARTTHVAPDLEREAQGSGACSLPVGRAATTVPSEQDLTTPQVHMWRSDGA